MKKRNAYIVLLVLFVFAGCAKILIPPHIQKVKKMAIISIYMNETLYDIKAQKSEKDGGILPGLVKNTVKIKGLYPEENQQILNAGLNNYVKNLDSIENWSVMPPTDLVSNEKYKDFMDSGDKGKLSAKIYKAIKNAEMDKWDKPRDMVILPLESIHASKGTPEKVRDSLGKLAAALGVDAVAVIELDIGYSQGTKLGVGLPINKTKIKPQVKTSIIAVTSDGNIAVKSLGTSRYNTKGVMLTMVGGSPVLKHKDDKAVNAFNKAVENSAIGVKEKIEKAFSKLK